MASLHDEAASFFYTGTRLLADGDLPGAEGAYRRALQLAPDLAEVHANLAFVLDRGDDRAGAEAHYRRALQLDPGQARIHLNFGALLASQKRFGEAETAYRDALQLDPDSPGAWSNLGVLLACVKREGEAERCHREALALEPAHRNATFNLAYILLRQGRFQEGWRCLEARDTPVPSANLTGNCPRWRGESLQGRALLIALEGGLGDMIQFCRYASLAKVNGAARVSVLCHPGLERLLSGMSGVDDAFAPGEPIRPAAWDFWTPPLSLPFRFDTRLETIPANLPYLHADPGLVRRWADVIGDARGGLRVGLAWRGNPQFENDADRSLPSLDTLQPLGAVGGVRLFSLQKGVGEAEATSSGSLPLVNLGPRITDLADTAAIVMNLDLVISVDTAIVHLAGALGRRCWVLLPDYKPDWRWLDDRCDSPWYPEVMRLFRQQSTGDWAPVIASVGAALREFVDATAADANGRRRCPGAQAVPSEDESG